MDPRNCRHSQWFDDTQPHEEQTVLKCADCGIFRGGGEPNPNFDEGAVDEDDKKETYKRLRGCTTCAGCGQVANDDDSTPWSYWARLEPPSNMAVVMGLVKPLTCPKCNGTGTHAGN